MTPILVIGGAGYIGSHTCKHLAENGFQPIVFDNLSEGYADFVRWAIVIGPTPPGTGVFLRLLSLILC